MPTIYRSHSTPVSLQLFRALPAVKLTLTCTGYEYIGPVEFDSDIAFTVTDNEPRLLGRRDVFTQFKVCFDDVVQITGFHVRLRGVSE